MKQANHGGIKGESVDDSESALVDTESSMTPSRQRRQPRLAAETEEGQMNSEHHLSQADDDAVDSTQQQDVTVGFAV